MVRRPGRRLLGGDRARSYRRLRQAGRQGSRRASASPAGSVSPPTCCGTRSPPDSSRPPHGRRYDDSHLTRVAVVLRAKRAGLTLDAIRELLGTGDPGARRQRLAAHREELRRRAAEAQACLDLVECALGCTRDDLADCPRFREIVATTAVGEELPATTGTNGATRWYGP
ncbi:MerR family DNA-binding protein [Streptomyces sp. NPDC055815]